MFLRERVLHAFLLVTELPVRVELLGHIVCTFSLSSVDLKNKMVSYFTSKKWVYLRTAKAIGKSNKGKGCLWRKRRKLGAVVWNKSLLEESESLG